MRRERGWVWRELHWPGSLDPDACLALLRQLASDRMVRLVAFELEASGGRLVYRVGIPERAADHVEGLLGALLVGVTLTEASARSVPLRAWRLALSTPHRPLVTREPIGVTRAILAAVTAAGKGEAVVLQWVLGPTQGPRPVSATTQSGAVEAWWQPLFGGSRPLEADRRKALQEKRADHAFACVGRLGVTAASEARATSLALGLLGGLRLAETPGVRVQLRRDRAARLVGVSVPWRWPTRLNAAELVGLLAWPLGDQPLPGLPRDQARRLRADPGLQGGGRVIARTTAAGDDRGLGLSIEDARYHQLFVGPTGVGKSTAMASVACQDIAAGRGVLVVDPKGTDLIDDVLARIPPERVRDVVVIDPADPEFAVGLNPLATHIRSPELVADQVLATFHSMYETSWGPRTADILHAACLTLASRGDASLCAIPALLTSPAARRRLREGVSDPFLLDGFWGWFDSLSDGERQQAINAPLNKVRPLLRKQVRSIVGQTRPRFQLSELFTHKRIVLVSLASGAIGSEAAAILGSLLIADLWRATLERAALPASERQVVVAYLDEFQTYVRLPTDLADALTMSRGLGLAWVLGHQNRSQLPAQLRAAVDANVRSKVYFQLASEDAQAVARTTGGDLSATDFERLGRYEVYLQLVANGQVTRFASGKTLPLPPPLSDPERVREASRLRYGRPVAEVEAEIAALLAGDSDNLGAVGRRAKEQQ